MECKESLNFERLIKISKILFPCLIVISLITFHLYRHSIDTVEITVVSKNIVWAESCGEFECIDVRVFIIECQDETFVSNEAIFNQLDENYKYIVGTKGWNYFGSHRELVHVY